MIPKCNGIHTIRHWRKELKQQQQRNVQEILQRSAHALNINFVILLPIANDIARLFWQRFYATFSTIFKLIWHMNAVQQIVVNNSREGRKKRTLISNQSWWHQLVANKETFLEKIFEFTLENEFIMIILSKETHFLLSLLKVL